MPNVFLAIVNCRTQLLFTGDSRVASLHLDRLKQECRDKLFKDQKYPNCDWHQPRTFAEVSTFFQDLGGN